MNDKTRIFTFWEPKDKMPGYLRACMRTWRFIPDSEIVLLDNRTLGDWLPQDEIDSVRCSKLILAVQADCYRALLLNRHGGIWFDVDTIVTPAIADEDGLLDAGKGADVTAFGRRPSSPTAGDGALYGCYFNALRPHTDMFESWTSQLPQRVSMFRRYANNPLLRLFGRKAWRKCRRWNYCLNDILDPLSYELNNRQLCLLDETTFHVHPELSCQEAERAREKYERYYFSPGDPAEALSQSKGLILLHNSWTPEKYRLMSETEFLKTDTRLAAILGHLQRNFPACSS